MTLGEISEKLGLRLLTPDLSEALSLEPSGGHVSDLLSDALANAPAGGVLVTIQAHMNVVAVAEHAELAAVVFAAGRAPEQSVRDKAAEEGIALFVSDESAFDIVGQMHALGLRGAAR